jgi:acyl-CoA synthetase (AMP-forming)/AMP-acid ligase II
MNVGETLSRHAQNRPTLVAVISGDRAVSYGALDHRVNRLANGLARAGIKKGDAVGLVLRNGVEIIECYFALAKIGSVSVPINHLLNIDSMIRIMRQADIKALVLEEGLTPAGEFRKELGELSALKNRIIRVGDGYQDGRLPERSGGLTYEEVVQGGDATEPDVPVDEADDFSILYSSGSTSEPKGIILTHHYRIWNSYMAAMQYGITHRDRTLIMGPLYHEGSAWFMFTHIHAGGSVVIMPRLRGKEILEFVNSSGATNAICVPTHLHLMGAMEGFYGVECPVLRFLAIGGAPLVRQVRQAIVDQLRCDVHFLYGTTENGVTTSLFPEDLLRKPDSAGQAYFHTEVRIVDDNGVEVPRGEVGEIISRGPTLMRGYLNDPVATAKAVRGQWFYSGDLGRMGEDGHVYVVDRKKDMIITGGVHVYCYEVEEALLAYPGIAEATVIGVPHEKWGEAVKAVVVPVAGSVPAAESIIGHCRERLPRYAVPKSVDVVDGLPKGPTGKVSKRALRERYL